MSEKSMFFNSIDGDVREYSAADFADCLSGICPDGVLEGLEVTPTNSKVNISAGKAVIKGYIYVLDDIKVITASSGNAKRFDRVVLKLDLANRNISAVVRTGTNIPPALGENEISLAVVTVQTNGAVTGVEDTREYSRDYKNLYNKPIYCGTSAPRKSLGNDGDIYVQYES